jgi:hypothetical protein
MSSKTNLMPAGLLLLATLLTAATPTRAAVGPFAAMAGSWSGGGTLTMADGRAERLRCRAAYDVGGGGSTLRLNLRCASDSYNFDLSSDVEYQGGAIRGSWSEASRNASGTISGRATGDQIQAAARGQNFAANLSLVTRGNRQTISIRSEGTEISGVSVALSRR